jgi:hypothetical protein
MPARLGNVFTKVRRLVCNRPYGMFTDAYYFFAARGYILPTSIYQ